MNLDSSSREDLLGFVDLARHELGRVVTEDFRDIAPRSRLGLSITETADLASEIWEELQSEFEDVISAIRSEEYDDALSHHGLYGAQLQFKLAVTDEAVAAAERARELLLVDAPEVGKLGEVSEREAQRKRASRRAGRLTRVRKFVAKLLKVIDILWDSLVAALGGIGGAIKEFKEALSARIEMNI